MAAAAAAAAEASTTVVDAPDLLAEFGPAFVNLVDPNVQKVLQFSKKKTTVRNYTSRNARLYKYISAHHPELCFSKDYTGPGKDPMPHKSATEENLLDYSKMTDPQPVLVFMASLRKENGNIHSLCDIRKYKDALM